MLLRYSRYLGVLLQLGADLVRTKAVLVQNPDRCKPRNKFTKNGKYCETLM
jgi:hypothetical protein